MNDVIIKDRQVTVKMEKANGVYQARKVSFIKAWWQKYLNRLNKVTNGKPQCCR